MNRFNNEPSKDEFALVPKGTYDALLENAVMDDVAIWENGADTGRKTTGIKLTYRIISETAMNRKMFSTLKFNNDDDFSKASNQLDHLGVWDSASKGSDESACIELAATALYKMVEGPIIVLYVGEYNERNYCKVQKLRGTTMSAVNEVQNHAPISAPPQMNKDERLPF